MQFHVIIPARYQSVRLPGKVLLDIAGKPMIERVYWQAQQSGAASVTVAADDQCILDVVENFNGNACITATSHQSGTERIAEAAKILNLSPEDIVVNVQGDEPLIPPCIIKQVAQNLHQAPQAKMATLCAPLKNVDELFNTDIVKCVRDKNDFALYFSRASIPWERDVFKQNNEEVDFEKITQHHFRHIGIYAYRVAFIQEYLSMQQSEIEQIEKLEQLRVLWHGEKIHVAIAEEIPAQDVNSYSDLEKIKHYFS
jgi:3-deoxy-manno-octulosonate cytidylyltransferase (CMP-KDO synthetase)